MNTITAEIGADITPLKKEALSAEQIIKATSKRIEEEARKQQKANTDTTTKRIALEEAAARRMAEASKKAKAILDKGTSGDKKEGVFSVVGDLAGKAGLGGLAGIATAGGAAVAVIGALAKSMWDAHEGARKTAMELGRMRADTYSLTGPQSGDAASSLAQQIEAKRRAKREAIDSHLLGNALENSQTDSITSLPGELINNKLGAMTGKKTAKDLELDSEAANVRELARLRKEAAAASEEDTEALRDRLTLGEREGALEESRLRTAREIAAVEHKLGLEHASAATMREATAPIARRGRLEQREINRQADEAVKDTAEALQSAKDQAAVQQAGARDELDAQRKEIERLERESANKRTRADGTNNEERKRGFNAAADQLDVQAGTARFKLAEMERAQTEGFVDALRSAQSAQVDLLSLTGKEVEGRARIHLLQEQIADNARRMDYATPAQRAQLQAANAGLQGQIEKIRIMDAMKSPTEKRQERADSRRARRAESAAMAREWDAFNRGGHQVRIGDHLLGGSTKHKEAVRAALEMAGKQAAHAEAQKDFQTGLDASQLAKDIKALLAQPARIA